MRTAVLDGAGALVSMAKVAHVPQSADHIDACLWWDAVTACLHKQRALLEGMGRSMADIGRIAVDGTSGSMVLVDKDLTPVSAALMYNSAGFAAEAEKIAQHAPDVHITRGANSALGRAMRLVDTAFGTPQHLMHQADYITAKLRGVGGVSDHNNALKTGYDPIEGWPDWVHHLTLPTLLPQVVPVGTPLGALHRDIALDFGLPSKAQICAGTTDSVAAFIAASGGAKGVGVTSLGTTLAVKILSDTRVDDPTIGLYAHRLWGRWVLGGASNAGGGVLLQHFTAQDIERLSLQINPAQKTGLHYVPLPGPGERFPVNDPDLQPCLTPRPADDAQFLQAMFEGMARIESRAYAAIADRGGPKPTQIFTAGGGAKNAVWQAIREGFTGVPISPAGYGEAAIGTARIALAA